MVFWFSSFNTVTTKSFEPFLIEKEQLPSPTGVDAVLVTSPTSVLTEIREYLRNYFGNPPHTPVLDIPESHLLNETDYIFLAREKGGRLVGTIRYRYVGKLMVDDSLADGSPSIYHVDAFCIHPDWRKRGVGDYLLTELQRYVIANKCPYSMFLKEGYYLPIMYRPIYSGQYVFRRIPTQQTSPHVRTISVEQAHRFLDIYHRLYPQVCIIRNRNGSYQWRLYKKGYYMILACFQDTYQRIDKERMGWCTAWLESSVVTEEIREEAAIELTNTLPSFDYVWMNKRWTGKNEVWTLCSSNRAYCPVKNGTWTDDGTFHWYTYQWSTNCVMETSMCLSG